MAFELHSQLAADCTVLGELPLSRVLLMNDARFPWLILVPKRENARELFDLSVADRAVMMEEIAGIAEKLKRFTTAEKINVAALGNMVPQLHVHIIARFTDDSAWPNPVWNAKVPRSERAPEDIMRFRSLLAG